MVFIREITRYCCSDFLDQMVKNFLLLPAPPPDPPLLVRYKCFSLDLWKHISGESQPPCKKSDYGTHKTTGREEKESYLASSKRSQPSARGARRARGKASLNIQGSPAFRGLPPRCPVTLPRGRAPGTDGLAQASEPSES